MVLFGQAATVNGVANQTVSIPSLLSSAAVSTAQVTITTAATDFKLAEISLAAGYLNTANKVIAVSASGTWTTVALQTPAWTFKVKLCTVSGCGSGTALTLLSWVSAAATASTTQTWIIESSIGTSATGASGTTISHGFADLPVGATGNKAFTGLHDANTAVSGSIDLTAALFLDITVQSSTGLLNTAVSHTAKIIQ